MNWEFKKENGVILARRTKSFNAFVIGKRFRSIEGGKEDKKIWIHQIISNGRMLFLCHGFSTSLMNSYPITEGFTGNDGNKNLRAVRVFYPGKVVIHVNLKKPSEVMILSEEGRVLAGSNVHGNGLYCVGESVNPFTMHPVEAIMNNKANNDLGWMGPALPTQKKLSGKTRIIEKWLNVSSMGSYLTDEEIEILRMLNA